MSHRSVGVLLSAVLLLTAIALAGVPGRAGAALQKPSYAAGDRWVYDLDGSLSALPGLNASDMGTFEFSLVGRVTVEVIALTTVAGGTGSIPEVRVDGRTSGFLNGTFSIPGVPGTATVTGTFTTTSTESWEDAAYFPIESRGTTTYDAVIQYLVTTTPLVMAFRVNATTTVSTIPPFELDVGQNASASLRTALEVNSTITIGGQISSSDSATEVASTWHREVLAWENVTVGAGTFLAYRLNQSLGNFPGLVGFSAGGNETAYFSNDVGYYVKREAYANGTRVADLSLTSYAYGTRPSGWTVVDFLLIVGLPLILLAIVARIVLHRRERRMRPRPPPQSPSPPQPPEGGDPGAR